MQYDAEMRRHTRSEEEGREWSYSGLVMVKNCSHLAKAGAGANRAFVIDGRGYASCLVIG